jgi:RimJ/RimL family protein N-acetyltransferase
MTTGGEGQERGLAVPGFLPEVLPDVEIGWRLDRGFWGQGLYDTEASTAAMRFGFLDCGLDRLVSIRQLENVGSARVMEKVGLVRQIDTVVPEIDRPVAVHAITRGEYRVRFGG